MLQDNSLLDWLLAAFGVLVVPLGLRAFKPWLAARLDSLPGLRATHPAARARQQALLEALTATRVGLIGLVSASLALRGLQPPPWWARLCEVVGMAALFVQIGLWLAVFVERWVTTSRDRALREDPEAATGLAAASFLLRLVIWSMLLLVLLDNLGINVTALLAGLGVGGLAVGLAVQNILKDLLASLSIVLDKPFQIGHFIIVDGLAGTVENIGLKTTRIRALDGEQYVFSNADLTTARVRNFRDLGERRIVHRFTLGLDSEPEALEQLPQLLREIVQSLPDTRFDRAHLLDVAPDGLHVEMVYWITQADYLVYMNTRHAINVALLRTLRARGMPLAQPVRQLLLRGGGDIAAARPAGS